MEDSEIRDMDEGSPEKQDPSVAVPTRGAKRMRYTSMACVRCKRRKIKCDGSSPCVRCQQTSTECVYTYRHSRDILQRDAELARINQKIEMMQHQIGHLTARLPPRGLPTQQVEPSTPGSLNIPDLTSNSQAGTRNDSFAKGPSRRAQKIARQPQYVGPTSSTFNFEVARKSLQSMGIPTDAKALGEDEDDNEDEADSQPLLHVLSDHDTISRDPLMQMSFSEALELTYSYEEEFGSIYPFLDVKELESAAKTFYESVTPSQRFSIPRSTDDDNTLSGGIVDVLKLTIAIASVSKNQGPTALSIALLESVESGFEGRLCGNSVDILEMQAWTLMSILQFHCNQDILAWRTIGLAGRAAVEMGLHQRETYFAKFQTHQDRLWVNKLFWCIYILDRRCSFATGLPFVINDLDIDEELPEPDDTSSPILKALISYGHIASRVWKTTFKLRKADKKDQKIEYLHFQVKQWQKSLASELRLDPTMPDMLAGQSRARNKIRVLLYLDGNQMCLMIYRNSLLSPATISKDLAGAKRAVEVAKDSICVLDRFHRQSDIFSTQQASFHYYLASGLAVLFLAVCHAPTIFNEMCREEYFLALDLIRQFSASSYVARKLWKAVKYLKLIGPKLGVSPEHAQSHVVQNDAQPTALTNDQTFSNNTNSYLLQETMDFSNWAIEPIRVDANSVHNTSMSGNQLSCQLTNMFEAIDPRYVDDNTFEIGNSGGLEVHDYGTTEDLSRSLLGLF